MAKRTKQHREPTKKQIATSRRVRQQQRWVYIGLGVVAALVLGIALVAVVDQLVVKPSRPVAVVNDVRLRADDYQSRVLYERLLLDTRLLNLQAQLNLLDPEEPATQFLVQYYQQLASQTQQERLGVDQQTVDEMVEEELARQKAAELGLVVTEDEVNEEIRAVVAAQSRSVTEAQATAIASTAEAATATAEKFTPTPEPTATPASDANDAATGTPSTPLEIPTPEPTPTLHIITDEEFSQGYADYLSVLSDQARLSEGEFREIVRAWLLVNKVADYFADQVPIEAEQINVSHIQVDTEEEAQAVLERLDAGEDFAIVATEVSTDTFTAEDGGELGWFLQEELAPRLGSAVEEAAFSLSPGEYSQPVSSVVGWHIVKVNERSVRPLTEFQLQNRRRQAYIDWLQEAQSAEGVEILWEPDMAPTDPLFEQSARLPGGAFPLNGGSQ